MFQRLKHHSEDRAGRAISLSVPDEIITFVRLQEHRIHRNKTRKET